MTDPETFYCDLPVPWSGEELDGETSTYSKEVGTLARTFQLTAGRVASVRWPPRSRIIATSWMLDLDYFGASTRQLQVQSMEVQS
jgi:hypothetical protein